MAPPSQRPHQPVGPDPGDEDRNEALKELGRRAGIWVLPLILLGALLTGLGIPLWISVIAMVIAMVILVFEVDI